MKKQTSTQESTNSKPQLAVRVAAETLKDLQLLVDLSHIGKTAHVQSALNEYLARQLPLYRKPPPPA